MTKINLQDFKADELSLWYRGVFDDAITDKLISISESSTKDGLGKSKKRVSFLMAESYQNIVRHGLKNEDQDISATFGLINRSGQFHIFSTNQISEEASERLAANLNELNQLDKQALREKYLDVLENGAMSKEGGAGLGLIEMSRKSDYPLQYHITEDQHIHELCIQIDKSISDKSATNLAIEESMSINQKMLEEDVMLLFKGDFSSSTANTVVSMLSKNFSEFQINAQQKKIFHVGVEMIQNIAHHGLKEDDKIDGLFLIATTENEVVISTINYIAPSAVEHFKQHLNRINDSSAEDLKKWYREKLKESAKNDLNNAGVGLIDLGKWIDQKIEFEFNPIEGKTECKIEVKLSLK